MLKYIGRFSFLLLLLIWPALSSQAGDNAAIVADRVGLRSEPGAYGKVLATLEVGTRLELLFVAGFSETIDGFAGGHRLKDYPLTCD